MRILFLSQWLPYPPNNGSKLRIYNLLRGITQHHSVTLLCFPDQADVGRSSEELDALCREVHIVPRKSFESHRLRSYLGFFRLAPRSFVDICSPELQQQLAHILATLKYDLVIASELSCLACGRFLHKLPTILEDPELGVLYEQFTTATTVWRRIRYGLTWFKLRYYMMRELRHFDACSVVSVQEQKLLADAAPTYTQTVEVIPNCINLADYAAIHEEPQYGHLIFTGPFGYRANYEAMCWFLSDVYPRIQSVVSDVQLTITGDHANLPLPAATNITLTGFVTDIRPLIARSWVSLVPLRIGGGTRLKILEAMALGTPVVTTTKGAEGLDAEHDVHLLIADTPQAFADAIIRLLQEPDLRRRLAEAACRLVAAKYDWSATLPRFLQLVERVTRPACQPNSAYRETTS